MSDGFPNLMENFNTAATTAAAGKLPLPLLLVHYQTAMRHGTVDAAEKHRLTDTLFDLIHKAMDAMAVPQHNIVHKLKETDPKEKYGAVLGALCSPEFIEFLPGDAGRRLAAFAIKATQSGEKIGIESFTTWADLTQYQRRLTELATLALQYADEISKPRPEASVETSKDIAPVKRITLKQAEGAQP